MTNFIIKPNLVQKTSYSKKIDKLRDIYEILSNFRHSQALTKKLKDSLKAIGVTISRCDSGSMKRFRVFWLNDSREFEELRSPISWNETPVLSLFLDDIKGYIDNDSTDQTPNLYLGTLLREITKQLDHEMTAKEYRYRKSVLSKTLKEIAKQLDHHDTEEIRADIDY